MRARHYSSTLSRWTSIDPLWPRFKQYRYCRSNPIKFSDPTGLQIVVDPPFDPTEPWDPSEPWNPYGPWGEEPIGPTKPINPINGLPEFPPVGPELPLFPPSPVITSPSCPPTGTSGWSLWRCKQAYQQYKDNTCPGAGCNKASCNNCGSVTGGFNKAIQCATERQDVVINCDAPLSGPPGWFNKQKGHQEAVCNAIAAACNCVAKCPNCDVGWTLASCLAKVSACRSIWLMMPPDV